MIQKRKNNKLINKTKKVGYFILNPFRKLYWFIFRPETKGVKAVIEHGGKILLVRLGYAHKKWTLPGGKVDRGESFERAVVREVQEEVGINSDEVFFIGEYFNQREFKKDIVKCFYIPINSPEVM